MTDSKIYLAADTLYQVSSKYKQCGCGSHIPPHWEECSMCALAELGVHMAKPVRTTEVSAAELKKVRAHLEAAPRYSEGLMGPMVAAKQDPKPQAAPKVVRAPRERAVRPAKVVPTDRPTSAPNTRGGWYAWMKKKYEGVQIGCKKIIEVLPDTDVKGRRMIVEQCVECLLLRKTELRLLKDKSGGSCVCQRKAKVGV